MAQTEVINRRSTKADVEGSRYIPVAEANAIIDGRLARRRAARLFYTVGLLFVLAAIGHAALDVIADAPVLRVEKIRVEGLSGSLQEEVRAAAQSYLGDRTSLLSFNTAHLRDRIEQNPLVAELEFERHFPDTLVISAVRRDPAALVSAGGFYLVDKEGRVMQKLQALDLSKYDFPYFTGLAAENLQRGEKIYHAAFYSALELCRLLRERNPELYSLVSEVNLGGGDSSGSLHEHSLTAHLKGGAEVRLGDRAPSEVLPALDLFLQMLKKQKTEISDLTYVDLRYKDRIFYMDRATFLASAAGVLDEAERLAAEEAAREKKSTAKAESKTKRLDPASKGQDERRSVPSTTVSSRLHDADAAVRGKGLQN